MIQGNLNDSMQRREEQDEQVNNTGSTHFRLCVSSLLLHLLSLYIHINWLCPPMSTSNLHPCHGHLLAYFRDNKLDRVENFVSADSLKDFIWSVCSNVLDTNKGSCIDYSCSQFVSRTLRSAVFMFAQEPCMKGKCINQSKNQPWSFKTVDSESKQKSSEPN